jgi:CRISPR-associated protein Csc1
MHIYRCRLTLMEKTFFSSREISRSYYTAPLIGNYALAYAMGLCQSPYFNDGTIHYREHLSELNERGIYVTPATIRGQPRFLVEQFNAQPETYWFAMGRGVLVTRPDGHEMEQVSGTWYARAPSGERSMARPANRPQFGRIRYLAVGNEATYYVLSQAPIRIPSYIRLGKFMSKAQVASWEVDHSWEEMKDVSMPFLLNPADLGPETKLHTFDLVTVPPTPLIKNARLSGRFYRLEDGTHLPAEMRFGIEGLS